MGPKEADLTGFQLYGWISAQPLMMMDGRDLQQQVGCLMKLKKLPVWIIEHVWAHKIMDIREGWYFSFLQDILNICFHSTNHQQLIKTRINCRSMMDCWHFTRC